MGVGEGGKGKEESEPFLIHAGYAGDLATLRQEKNETLIFSTVPFNSFLLCTASGLEVIDAHFLRVLMEPSPSWTFRSSSPLQAYDGVIGPNRNTVS